MKKILIIILCICGFTIHAQDVFNRQLAPTTYTESLRNSEFIQNNVINRARNLNTSTVEERDIIGSAYLEEGFKEGQVFYNDTNIGDYLLRYNVYGEEFEILNLDETKSAVSKTSEVNITIRDKKYVFKYYLDDDERSKFGYFEVLSNPNNKECILLKKNKKLFSESRKAVTSFDINRPARFVSTESYYLLFSDKEIAKIRLQNGYITRFFKKRGADVKSFIKENELNVKNIEDLKKVVDYYNTTL